MLRYRMPIVGARLALALLVACCVWLPCLHYAYAPEEGAWKSGTSREARALAENQLALWDDESDRTSARARMLAVNPEWDFMRRTYLVLALTNMAIASPKDAPRYLGYVDSIVDDTLAIERGQGKLSFMMAYATRGRFVDPEARSLFIDGEIAMMIAARQLVSPRKEMLPELRERTRRVARSMEASPTLSGESYPDECWTFCNTTALAALTLAERADPAERRHDDLRARWVALAKERLTDRATGLLVSSYTRDGHVLDGPEGSSIWMSAHNLLLVDEEFAKDQYARAKKELAVNVLGFGYAREWPRGQAARPDVDSGPIVPFFEASAGSSGLAILGASAFGDDAYLESLLTSLRFVGFPAENGGKLSFVAGNAVGDSVVLSALAFGPLWERAKSDPGNSALSRGDLR